MRSDTATFLLRLRKTLLSRVTLQFTQGPALMVAAFVLIRWLDPVNGPGLRWIYLPPYLLFFSVALTFCNYRLINGQWNLSKWSRRIFIYGLPVPIFYAYLCMRAPIFFPVAAVSTIAAGLPVIGLIQRRYWSSWYITFMLTNGLLFALYRPDYPLAHLPEVLISVSGFTAVFIWLIALNGYTGQLNQKMRRGLIETRKRRRALDAVNKQLADRNRRMERDLLMARKVQEGILPRIAQVLPYKGPVQATARYLALKGVGGDYYDVVRLDEDHVGFFITDVSGHGVSAALVTTMTKVAFTTHAWLFRDPAALLGVLNEELCRSIGDLSHYLTAYYCIINTTESRLSYSSAGHPAALLYRPREETIEELTTNPSFFLGVEPDGRYVTKHATLEEGDRLLMFTDGLIEMESPGGEPYGEYRLSRFLIEQAPIRGDEFIEELLADLDRFTNDRTPEDDIAVICIDYGEDPVEATAGESRNRGA